MLYCEDCKAVYDTPRCAFCGNKRGREVTPEDICYLTEVEYVWSDMLSDVLNGKSILHIRKNLLGAGLTVKLGSSFERVDFYVKYKDLAAAKEVVEELFENPDEKSEYPEEYEDKEDEEE